MSQYCNKIYILIIQSSVDLDEDWKVGNDMKMKKICMLAMKDLSFHISTEFGSSILTCDLLFLFLSVICFPSTDNDEHLLLPKGLHSRILKSVEQSFMGTVWQVNYNKIKQDSKTCQLDPKCRQTTERTWTLNAKKNSLKN